MQKLFCYVDETGQDTVAQNGKKRALFVVGMVVLNADQRQLERVCIQYEKRTGKGSVAWHRAKYAYRLEFMRAVFADQQFTGTLYYRVFQQPAKLFFDTYTLQGIADALQSIDSEAQSTKEIYVDGLSRSKQSEYGVELRRLGVQRASFHRATDQSSPLIRLADALVGLVREAEEGTTYSEASQVLKIGKNHGVIVEGHQTKNHPEVVF